MPDYEGPLEGFAMVLLVPADVTVDKVTTLKRDFVDRLDSLSAPRFHEYWEQDPCDPGPRRAGVGAQPEGAGLPRAARSVAARPRPKRARSSPPRSCSWT